MIPPIADNSDPDPTTQVPWPAARNRTQPDSSALDAPPEYSATATNGNTTLRTSAPHGKRMFTVWDLITLSISMAGAQITWTVELGYGTPVLLGLGLSEQLTSLVWLAGPISGLVAQPVIGALSDASTSKYRRRFWIILSTGALIVSTLTLAYCQEIAAILVDFGGVGKGDWDEERKEKARSVAIGFAVVAFYFLDFALNGLQASLRNLLLDITPPQQVNAGNAWHGRMTNAGNIVGYGFGFLPLAQLPIIRLLGGDQFRKFCIICITILVATVAITCFNHAEEERPKPRQQGNGQGQLGQAFTNIRTALLNLPKPIRRVCYVQLFAFMGWFPFLFYSTTYVGQIMAFEIGREPDPDVATRTGAFAMLIYSVVGVAAGTLLPHLASRDRRLMGHKTDVDGDAELSRIRAMVRKWRVEAAQASRPLHLPVMPFLLRNIWTGALLFFSFLMFSTFFISTVAQATVFISLVGICWAVAMWVPFAIIMELLKEPPQPSPATPMHAHAYRRPSHLRNLSTPARPSFTSETRPLIQRRRSFDEYDTNPEEEEIASKPLPGGTILGIHNLAIVMPQFIVAIVGSMIFKVVDGAGNSIVDHDESTYFGKNGVAWVLRFGGLATLIGAAFARKVAPTPTEKAMRRRLGEMKILGEEGSP
ncbi:MFS general substrate transporter [Crepidotus variabilis]|uniref:MFS general substrate transporter n=1 Tax=Crepidotus variabilis TaxID=179855 RepID=A0A9P6ERQ8_9AGAR|nr:MFS general substrate transporter [Crepidotus variabilis]